MFAGAYDIPVDGVFQSSQEHMQGAVAVGDRRTDKPRSMDRAEAPTRKGRFLDGILLQSNVKLFQYPPLLILFSRHTHACVPLCPTRPRSPAID